MTSPTDARELLTVDQVAQELQVHPETIRRLIRTQELRATRVGTIYRIKRTDLDAYLHRGHGHGA